MNHIGTDPEISETELNGRPDGEEERFQCDLCLGYHRDSHITDVVICDECRDNAASAAIRGSDLNACRATIQEVVKRLTGLNEESNLLMAIGNAKGMLLGVLNRTNDAT